MAQSKTNRTDIQFSLKSLFWLTTVVAALIVIGLAKVREAKLKERAESHYSESISSSVPFSKDPKRAAQFLETQRIYLEYHKQMADKYKRAALFPFLFMPLDPEPPAPLNSY